MADTKLLAIDESSRRRALELASFIVEAPAGAGKTELLTQRTLRLLATVKEPEEIIAITFTRKAAAEMRARILNSLSAATRPPVETLPPHVQLTRKLAQEALARDIEYGWRLLENPSRLRVTTIDSLSASLARQMPFLSRFGAQPAVCEGDQAKAHYESAAVRTLALLEEEDEAGKTVEEALRYFDNDTGRLQKLLVSMLEKRDQWLGHIAAAEQGEDGAIALLVASDMARAGSAVGASMQAQLMATARYAAGNLIAAGSDSAIKLLADWSQPLSGDLSELNLWRGLAGLLLTNSGTLRRRFDKNMGLPAEKEAKPFKDALAAGIETLVQTPGAEQALARIQLLPEPRLDAEEARIVAIFARLLKLAAAQLWTVFQQQREVDFIEVAQRALLALGESDEPSNLQLKLDYRISHLLVDEFQDTSPAQITLLERLTAGWQQDDGRTLFVVGDPMQSIYRFRKADVGLFLQVRDVGIGPIRLETLRLNRNNRSHPEVVDWINAAFPEVFPPADNPQSGAVKFAASVATKPAVDKTGVFAHAVLVAEEAERAGMAEAQQVIGILRRERAAYPGGTIAILIRTHAYLEAFVSEMRRLAPELRFQAVEAIALADRQVVQDLLALTRALHHRADRVNWLAALRAPWCGLALSDLHALAADDHQGTLWQLMNDDARIGKLSADGQQRLLHLRGVFAEVLAQQGRLRTRRWLEAAWRMLGGAACLHDAAEGADAEAYFRLIDRLDAEGGFTLARLDKEIASLYAEPDPKAGGLDSPAIQIMTVHKSKGLEFDSVILPGLHRALRSSEHNLLLWEEFVDGHGHEQLVIAPVKPRRGGKIGSNDKRPSAYDYLKNLDDERSANEDARVLYVAATRAIRTLHLVGVATVEAGEEGKRIKLPKKGSPLAALWPTVEAEFVKAVPSLTEADGAEAPDPACFVPKLLRLSLNAIESPDPGSVPPADAGASASLPDDDIDPGGRSLGADIGSLVHRLLELVAEDGLAAWNAERIDALEPVCRRWLESRGHAAAKLDAAARQARDAVCKAVASEDGRWLLAPRESADNEIALTACRDAALTMHVIDRTFVEAGERWIIDYKTEHFGGEPEHAELHARAALHRPQLERYAALFAEEGLPIRMAIFFPACGKLIELPRQTG